MKKSRIAKLALMGASITALAATLTTSTYAWYVSNKTAKVNGGLGATNSAAADGSILLSWDNEATTYYKSIAFSDTNSPSYSNANQTGSFAASKPLDPVQWNATGSKFVTLTADATDNQYIGFSLYIKSDSQVTVTPTITITNTTTTYTNQIAYTDTGLPTGVNKGQQFHVDALEAIYTQQKVTYASALNYVDAADYNATNSTSLTDEQFDALSASEKVKVAAGTNYSYVAASTTGTGGNAHTYYNSVVAGTTTPALTEAQKANVTASGLSQIVVPASTPLQLFYVIYLNGADTDCFNSCAGQTISFELSFSVNA